MERPDLQEKAPKLGIATLNVDNIKTNACYVRELLQKYEILLIQEHWLHRYEENVLDKLFPNFQYHIKCYDDTHPKLPLQASRGQAGVMFIWQPNINHAVTTLPDGSPRMIAIQVQGHGEIITIANTYMPADGSKDKESTYESVLDEVYELYDKYKQTTVIWGGDLNGSLHRRNSKNDKALQEFCKEQSLTCLKKTPCIPTYYHFAQNITSTIDMFIVQEDTKHENSHVEVDMRNAVNTGPHDPVITQLQFKVTEKIREPKKKQAEVRINWAKVDPEKYEALTRDRISQLGKNGFNKLHPQILVSALNKVLVDSAHKASGGKKNVKKRNSKMIWCDDLKPYVKASKLAHYRWKQNKEDHKLIEERRRGKRLLRAAQRRVVAERREEEQREIMEAEEGNRQSLYKLIEKQRQTKQAQVHVMFKNENLSQIDGWQNYFQALATPVDKPEFDRDYKDTIEMQVMLVEDLNKDSPPEEPVMEKDIKKHITSLKNGKAPDIYGVSAEHLKFSSPVVNEALQHITNNTLSTGRIVPQFKLGVLTPIPKPGKQATNPDNHRRITVCSILGKIVEKEVTKRSMKILDPKQSKLQFGFSKNCSPSMCALILTEAIAEAQDKEETLYVTYMDVKKAFDTVWHSAMLIEMFNQGIKGTLWNILNDMYSGIKSQVKVQGELSEELEEFQGIRQGAESSTGLYKGKSNKMLNAASSHPLAYRIGTVPVGAPTTADDTAFVASSQLGAQTLVGIAQIDSNHQRYSFSSQKTKVMAINKKPHIPEPQLKLNGVKIDLSTQERHLGIERTPNNSAKATIQSRIKGSRRSVYSLAGAGMYGYNGVGPRVTYQMIKTYIIPILTYGLEAVILQEVDYRELETFYKTLLRQIQHLPESTATPAIYLLLGSITLEGLIHIKMLTFFGSVLRREGSTDNQVIKRQLAMKDLTSSSWVVQIRTILHKYQLPSAYKLAQNPPEKLKWKRLVKDTVNAYWTKILTEKAQSMKTLSLLNIEDCTAGIVHDVWYHTADPLDVQMATIKAKLLVQRYPLGYSYCAGKGKAEKCALCDNEEETINHFLLTCPTLATKRSAYLQRLYQLLLETNSHLPKNAKDLLTLILTPAKLVEEEYVEAFEQLSRRLIFKLHQARSVLMGGEVKYNYSKTVNSSSKNNAA